MPTSARTSDPSLLLPATVGAGFHPRPHLFSVEPTAGEAKSLRLPLTREVARRSRDGGRDTRTLAEMIAFSLPQSAPAGAASSLVRGSRAACAPHLPGGLGATPPFLITQRRTARRPRRMPFRRGDEDIHSVRSAGFQRKPRCVLIGAAHFLRRWGFGGLGATAFKKFLFFRFLRNRNF